MPSTLLGSPGVSSNKTSTPRRVFLSEAGKHFYPSSLLISGANSRDPGNTGDLGVLRAGTLMGKNSSGLYCPFAVGVLQSAYTSGGLSVTVSAAQAVEIVRRIGSTGNLKYVGPPSANGTVATASSIAFSAVNTSTGVITCSNIGISLVAGSFVCPTGVESTPLTFIDDGDGVMVIDPEDLTSRDTPWGRVPIAGMVDSSQLLVAGSAFPTDTSLQAWIAARVNDYHGCKFTFDHFFV